MNRNLGRLWDRVFGNRDGKFDWKDIPKSAPAVVALVVDVIMLVVEWRVYDVGIRLTRNFFAALGFVAVSSIPFYLGQLAYLYNRANRRQQAIAVLMVLMGLGVSAFLGFADLFIGYSVQIDGTTTFPLGGTGMLFTVVIFATTFLIVGGLLYGLFDDQIAMRLKETRMRAQFEAAKKELELMEKLALEGERISDTEDRLRKRFGDEYFDGITDKFRGRRREADEQEKEKHERPQQASRFSGGPARDDSMNMKSMPIREETAKMEAVRRLPIEPVDPTRPRQG